MHPRRADSCSVGLTCQDIMHKIPCQDIVHYRE